MSCFPPPLIAVAHGSRDPRSAATVFELAELLRSLRPELDVRVAFLDLSAPRLGEVLAAVHGEGHSHAVVVPLLLGRAYHARVDVPGAVAETTRRHPRLTVSITDVLGPDPLLESAALRRLALAGVHPEDPDFGVVLAAAGSSHRPANAAVASVAQRWAASTSWAGCAPAFAAGTGPGVANAVGRLRAVGARRIAVGSWFLAPGLLPDRIAARAADAADAVVAAPLGADVDVARVVLRRYAEADLAQALPA